MGALPGLAARRSGVGPEVFVVPCCAGVVVVVVLLAMLVVVCWLFDEEACWLEPSRLARKPVASPQAFSEFGEGPDGFFCWTLRYCVSCC